MIDSGLFTVKKRLSEIEVGKTAIIKEFESCDLQLKLMEMGFIPGEKVKIDQRAPLGDPISILVSGYRLSLRLDEARMIWAEEILITNSTT